MGVAQDQLSNFLAALTAVEVSFPHCSTPHSLIADGGDGSEDGVDGGLRMGHH
jgi:hypothetical protein